jgi:hypothetical protein
MNSTYNLADPPIQVYQFTGNEKISIGEKEYVLKDFIEEHRILRRDVRSLWIFQGLVILTGFIASIWGW